jgi:large subunit ribosomal protein L32
MPVPKRKRSKRRRDSRFANKGIKVKALATCQSCSEVIRPHQVCNNCGHYKGVKVMDTKNDRTVKRTETRQAQATKKQARTPEAEQMVESEENK